MDFEQRYSGGQLYIGEESFPVKECELRVETIRVRATDVRRLSECTFICGADMELEWRVPFELRPSPLCDIEYRYITYKKRLFVDVPIENCLRIKGAKVGTEPEFTFLDGEWEVVGSFRDGDWVLELGAFTWREWWRALCAKFGEREPNDIAR